MGRDELEDIDFWVMEIEEIGTKFAITNKADQDCMSIFCLRFGVGPQSSLSSIPSALIMIL